MTNSDTDEKLIERVASGDEKAFGIIASRYHCKVIRLIRHYLKNDSEPEDLAQEVFIKVWKNARKFRNESKFSTWLFRITVNMCLNHCRSRKKEKKRMESRSESLDQFLDPDSHCGAGMGKSERNQMVAQAVGKLPGRQRIVIVLFHFEGYRYDEIAEIMNVSKSAVESLLFRARNNLAKVLIPSKKISFGSASIFQTPMSNR